MKKKSGFTLLEVILSLFILVSAVSILTSLHLKFVNRLQNSSDKLNRIFLVEKILLDFYLKQPVKDKPWIENIENPNVKITTQLSEINKKSSLIDFKDFIHIVESVGEWQNGPDNFNLEMLTFVLIPEKENKS
ncbi:prepilin-type N-terminal cleavage/methylation domain-containing protein [Candidatus Dependentiae bacterium]|nr:prepilin-type N-terminal cleavage/methylation domain-containing protein [Candidatus Dependentiae bacterium]